MLETFIALLAAHVIADFVLQFEWIIENKQRKLVFGLHVLIVGLTTALILGAYGSSFSDAIMASISASLAHALIDAAKLWSARLRRIRSNPHGSFNLFVADQVLHLISLIIIAACFDQAWNAGLWNLVFDQHAALLLAGLCSLAGFILTTRTGEFLLRAFMSGLETDRDRTCESNKASQTRESEDPGVPNGGKWIGLLERTLIFFLVMLQQFEAIGFLIAAKSILRFQYARERSHSEIVIIGTLASFSWAILMSWITLAGIRALI